MKRADEIEVYSTRRHLRQTHYFPLLYDYFIDFLTKSQDVIAVYLVKFSLFLSIVTSFGSPHILNQEIYKTETASAASVSFYVFFCKDLSLTKSLFFCIFINAEVEYWSSNGKLSLID